MRIGGGEQEEEGQARAATQERMHAVAAQEGTRMMSRRVTHGRVGIGPAPGQNRGAINDEVTRADEAPTERKADHDDEQGLGRWRSSVRRALPLLRGTRHK
jgi:hypothetical protein